MRLDRCGAVPCFPSSWPSQHWSIPVAQPVHPAGVTPDREPEQVIADVRLIGYDVVRSRIPNQLVRDDSIHLQVATNYTNGVHSLLAATATTEIEPQPYFL